MTPWPQPPKPCVVVDQEPRSRRRARKHGTKGVWGHHFKKISSDCLRILCYNTGGIGFLSDERTKESLKMHKLKKLVLENQVDIMALTELNKDWRTVPHAESIWSALSGWRENKRIQVSSNTFQQAQGQLLIGGTATCCLGDCVFRISSQGSDERNLGRWSYIILTGKNNIKTILITCYCPVKSSSPGSAYAQQLTYITRNKDKIPNNIDCPRQLFGHDLRSLIESKQDSHQILLCGDFNSGYDDLTDYMLELGLQDVIAKQHGRGPITYQRSADSPIDRIFGSVSLKARHSGFLSFGRLSGDHRGIWIEIPKILLYGYNPPQPVHVDARRLKLSDPRVVVKYLEYLHNKCVEHNIYLRMDALHQYNTLPLPQCIIDEYEALDVLISQFMQEAEKQCRKLHMNSVPWSPAYKKACLLLDYWIQRRIYFKGMHHNVRQLQVLQNKLKLVYDGSLSLEAITKNIISAHSARKLAKKGAESLSLEYRTQLALAKEAAGELKAASYIRQLQNAERTRKVFQQIRHMEGKIFSGFTSRVSVVNEDGTTTDYTDRAAIEKLLLDTNELKYHQTEDGGSQLLDQEFIDLFGHYGEGPRVVDVLLGDATLPQSTSQATRDFLTACKIDPTTFTPTPPPILERYEKYKKSWNIRKEKTLTYNEHIGHYKASMKHDDLSWLLFQKMDFLSNTGYSPSKHRRCIDLMILKKSNSYVAQKQRTLGILDTEFNHINNILGRDSMFAAIDSNNVANEQFCRPGRCSIDQTILKRCTFDHLHYNRKCFALTSCDLAGCYDRIIHTAASLALQRVGIPAPRIHSMFHSIQHMVHKVRTAFGDSTDTYGGTLSHRFLTFPQGVLQGNASGPTIWTILSSVIFSCLHSRGFSACFCSALSLQLFSLVGFCYVDDCDLIQTGEDPVTVITSMQNLIKSWKELMQVTGAAIATDKSWWYLVDFQWKNGKWVTCDPLPEYDLTTTDCNDEYISLKRLISTDATEMLGVWMAPNGCKKKIIRTLRDSSLDSASKLTIGNANSYQAWTALQSNIFARLKYPAAACTFSKQECDAIMWPALRVCLSRSGFCSSISSSIRHGPSNSGGGGFPSYFDYMGTQRTAFLLQNAFSNSPTYKSILNTIEDIILEAGMYGSIWSWDFNIVKKWLSPHSWIYHVLQYNFDNNILINIPHAMITPIREKDKSLMSVASNIYHDSSSLKAINRVRMYHNIVHLSDICQADGYSLDTRFFLSTKFPERKNKYSWPLKHHVSSTDFTSWRKFLRSYFIGNMIALPHRLLRWSYSHTSPHCYWYWFLSTDRTFLYHRWSDNVWHRHVIRDNSHYMYHRASLDVPPPTQLTLLPCSVHFNATTIKILSISVHSYLPSSTTDFEWADMIPYGNTVHYPFLKNISHSNSTNLLHHHIMNGTSVAASDGSYFESHSIGAYSWIVATPDHQQWIKGYSISPGTRSAQSAFRSELCGQAAIASFFQSFCLHQTIPLLQPSIKIPVRVGIDCQPTIPRINVNPTYLKSSMKHIDVISAISALWTNSRFEPRMEYVMAHQDKYGIPLEDMAVLNDECDHSAKTEARRAINAKEDPPLFSSPHGYFPIFCHGQLVCSRIQQSLMSIISHHRFTDKLAKEFNISSQFCTSTIHWKSYGRARKEESFKRRAFVTKMISDTHASGVNMLRRKQRIKATCPFCHINYEDLQHIFHCPAISPSNLRQTSLQTLKQWLIRKQTQGDILHFIISFLDNWFSRPTMPLHFFSSDGDVNNALYAQSALGGWALLCGFISKAMVSLQQSFYSSIHSRRTGSRWATETTKQLWLLSFNIWDHRCSHLHDSPSFLNLHGLSYLKERISYEYTLGHSSLPTQYKKYFRVTLPDLLSSQPPQLKSWFLLIRSIRETTALHLVTDRFLDDKALRRWIGLPIK